MKDLPVHFFTIVRNGQPFITWHLEQFRKLEFPWTWHVIEGVAELKHDTAWCLRNGGRAPFPQADDGTLRYLNNIQGLHGANGRVRLATKCCGRMWDGKIEMVRKPLQAINEPCLLMEIDADEIWTAEQLIAIRQLFLDHPEKTAAFFKCWYFVGPDIVTTTLNTYGNYLDSEWLRAWRYYPGAHWQTHEPPVLMLGSRDVAKVNPFTHAETEHIGRFQHYAYATNRQVAFKQFYYGYSDALLDWTALQENREWPTKLAKFFRWVKDEAVVDKAANIGLKPLIKL